MQENIEVNNPMYIQDDIDDEDIHLERAFPLQEKVRCILTCVSSYFIN